MGSRGRRSVWRAREFFDRELFRGEHPTLRHGEQPSSGATKTLPYSIFEPLDLEAPPADALFFVVEERSGSPREAGGGARVRARGSSLAGSQPAGAPAGYPWVGTSAAGEVGHGRGEQGSLAAATSVASDVRGGEGSSGTDRGGTGSPRCVSGNGKGGGGGGGSRGGHHGEEGGYTVPYWAIVRVGESESDPGDDPRSWPMIASGLSVANGGANGGTDGGDGYSHGHSHGGGKAPVRMASRLMSPPPPPRVHRPTYSPDAVGYRIAVIDIKVSLYHPKGSVVAASKDAIMAGLTRVSLPSWVHIPVTPTPCCIFVLVMGRKRTDTAFRCIYGPFRTAPHLLGNQLFAWNQCGIFFCGGKGLNAIVRAEASAGI